MALRRRRFQRKAKKTARKAFKRAAPGIYKAVKAVARNEALKSQETKLVINTPFFGGGGPANLISNRFISSLNIGNLSYLQPAIPGLRSSATTQESNAVLGSKINLVSGHTDFLVCFKNGYTASSDVIVKIFCVHSKSAKSFRTASNLAGGNFLRVGDSTTVDWSPASTVYLPILENYPVNTLAWKVSEVFTCRLSKNSGGMNLDSSTPPPGPNLSDTRNYHHFKWHWGKDGPNVLKFDEPLQALADNYPTNFMPMYGCAMYYPDGTSVGEPGDPQVVVLTASNTIYFKDA
uniref:Uncharacterized protein n=1 Tax=Diporeia sp. associated circular virus TaxID=1299317 RepID=M1T808_9VIRU|nr:hypothetical protein [Diporeia sp. associated circular virus]